MSCVVVVVVGAVVGCGLNSERDVLGRSYGGEGHEKYALCRMKMREAAFSYTMELT